MFLAKSEGMTQLPITQKRKTDPKECSARALEQSQPLSPRSKELPGLGENGKGKKQREVLEPIEPDEYLSTYLETFLAEKRRFQKLR